MTRQLDKTTPASRESTPHPVLLEERLTGCPRKRQEAPVLVVGMPLDVRSLHNATHQLYKRCRTQSGTECQKQRFTLFVRRRSKICFQSFFFSRPSPFQIRNPNENSTAVGICSVVLDQKT